MIAKRNLGDEFHIVRIPHYANYVSKEGYRSQLDGRLPKLSRIEEAEQN